MLRRKEPWASGFTAFLLAAAGLGFAAALTSGDADAAQARRLTITQFDATYRVRRDAVLEVEERITVRFDGSWNGIYRYIPIVYRLKDGKRHRIHLDLRSVEDDRGSPLRHEAKREGSLINIKTWVPGARDAERTLVYRYEVENGLRYFDDDDSLRWAHDELYWNVTGDEWEMPILEVRATVHLPEGATGVRGVAYTGRGGSTAQDYTQSGAGTTLTFESTRTLNRGEGLTVVVGWDPGPVQRPAALTRARWFFLEYMFVPFPFIAFALMLWLWREKGRDPELGRSIMPQYEPPQGMSPAEVGTLMDFRVDSRDLSATIIDLAIRGYLRIEEVASKRRTRPKDHIIHVLKDPRDLGDLKEFEREVIEALRDLSSLEDGGHSIRVSKLKQKFYKHVPTIRRSVLDLLITPPKLFTARPERVQGAWVGIGIVVGVFSIGAAVIATALGIGRAPANLASMIAVPVIVIGFGLFMPARTLKGATMLKHVLGLREYIDRVDRHRLKHITLEHFETLLPFAAAMGLEEKWTEAFESIIKQPPEWYVSAHPTHFHAHIFSRSLGRMTTATGTALVTAPRSASGGSGFSGGGGGFSGGGFGGGGGGGF